MSNQLTLDERRSRRTTRILILFLAAVVVAVIAVSARAFIGSSEHPVKAPPTAPSKPARSQEQPPAQMQTAITLPRLEAEHITITPTGFEPSEITRPAGQILLAVNNRSGLDDVTIRVDIEGGLRVAQAHESRTRLSWRGAVTLLPGRYVITEANHPDWVCRIIVTAQ